MTEDSVEEGGGGWLDKAHSDEMESGNDGDDNYSKRAQKKVLSKGGRPRGKNRGSY